MPLPSCRRHVTAVDMTTAYEGMAFGMSDHRTHALRIGQRLNSHGRGGNQNKKKKKKGYAETIHNRVMPGLFVTFTYDYASRLRVKFEASMPVLRSVIAVYPRL